MGNKHLTFATHPLGKVLLFVVFLDILVDECLFGRLDRFGLLGLGGVVGLDTLVNGDYKKYLIKKRSVACVSLPYAPNTPQTTYPSQLASLNYQRSIPCTFEL